MGCGGRRGGSIVISVVWNLSKIIKKKERRVDVVLEEGRKGEKLGGQMISLSLSPSTGSSNYRCRTGGIIIIASL